MSDKNMPRSSDKKKPSFKLEVSDLDAETYLAVNQASSDDRLDQSSHSSAVPYRAIPAISVSYKGAVQSNRVDPSPTNSISYSIPTTLAGSRWCIRRVGRAGRPRGSRAVRPRVDSYTSKFASVAKNLSYRGCLSDLLSHQGRISRLQILDKDLAKNFENLLQSQLAVKQARETDSTSVEKCEPISPPSRKEHGSDDSVLRPQIILSATPTNLLPENKSKSPVYHSISSPEAGPSGLQSLSHHRSGPSFVSEKKLYGESDFYKPLHDEEEVLEIEDEDEEDPLQFSPYEKDENKGILPTKVESGIEKYQKDSLQVTHYSETTQNVKYEDKSPEGVLLYKTSRTDVIEISSDSDSEDVSSHALEERQDESYMSDLYTMSKYYPPPTLTVNPQTVAENPPTVAVNPTIQAINPPTVAVNPPTVAVNQPTVSIYKPPVKESPLTVAVYPPKTVAVNRRTVTINPPNFSVNANYQYTAPNPFRRRLPLPYRPRGCVPGTYIQLTGSHFYGTRNVEFNAPPPPPPPPALSPVRPQIDPPVVIADDDEEERLLASPSYDVPELDLFNYDGLTEALSYINPDYNKAKPQTPKTDNPQDMPGPSGIGPPKKRGQKSSRRKSTVRLATPRPARPSRSKTSRSITGVRSTISDLTDLCGNVRTTTAKETLPCGRKVFVGGGLPSFRIPPASEVRKVAMEAMTLGHTIRESHSSQEEDVLEDIVSWLMDNPSEELYRKFHPNE